MKSCRFRWDFFYGQLRIDNSKEKKEREDEKESSDTGNSRFVSRYSRP